MQSKRKLTKDINFVLMEDSDVSVKHIIHSLRKMDFIGEIFVEVNAKLGYQLIKKKLQEATPIDVILCDLHMPNNDGLDFLRQVKIDSNFPEIPILMLTSEEDIDLVLECLKEGATGYALKKLEGNHLFEKIEESWNKVYK